MEPSICRENRLLFKKFFEYEEYKLKRQNGLSELDEPSYNTLYCYINRLTNVNRWFDNKPWKNLTKADILKVYNDLEDGKIRNRKGVPFLNRRSYYNKVLKSKPFKLAGKAELAKEVIEFCSKEKEREVRYVTEETFRKMVSVLSKPAHLALFWLAWDIGENIGALLKLSKRDFRRNQNPNSGEAEYLVHLPKEKIKRSRIARSEPTLYPETVQCLDMILEGLKGDDIVFCFGYRQALKVMHSVQKRTGAKSMPNNDPVRWKDLRSGMACHLLRAGWTRDEVNARLGHKPSSSTLDAYINYLAIDRWRPKEKLHASSLQEIQNDLGEAKRRENLMGERLRRQSEDNLALRSALDQIRQEMRRFKETLKGMR